jgi:hypothetical protein
MVLPKRKGSYQRQKGKILALDLLFFSDRERFSSDKERQDSVHPVRNDAPLFCSSANGGMRSQNNSGVV